MSADGKRHKKYFDNKTAADKYAAKLRSAYASGHRGSMIPATLALQAAEAARILEGTGVSIVEAARMAAARAGGKDSGETFRERLARAEAAGEAHWSDRYRDDVARIPRWVPAWFMSARCAVLDRAEMERALTEDRTLARSTIDTRCRYLSAVVGFRDRHRKSSDVAILTPRDCGRLLRATESKQEVMAVALLLFAGIRPDVESGEITRLDWEDVGKNEIYLSREVSKVGDRHVPITPRLRRLIKGHPEDGTVIPANWQRVWPRLRKAAGITAQDVTRHTFASNYLAAYGEDKAKAAMGHTAGSSTLFRHYRRAVTEADGKKFFR
jgi:hypothetical protein